MYILKYFKFIRVLYLQHTVAVSMYTCVCVCMCVSMC